MADENSSLLLEQPKIVTIESDRFQLQTLQMSDLDAIMPIISSKAVMQFTTQGPMVNRQQGERWLSARALGPDVFNFAIRRQNGDQKEIIGILGSFHWPNVGYLIHPDHAGKGYATEALEAFLPAYFERVPCAGAERPGFDHIDGHTLADNIASQRILKKCGFVEIDRHTVDFDRSPGMEGSREAILFRLPRPGKILDQRGQVVVPGVEEEEDAPPEAPIQ